MCRSVLINIKQGVLDHGLLAFFLYGLSRVIKKFFPQCGVEYFHVFAIPVSARQRLKIPAPLKSAYHIEIHDQPNSILSAFKVPPKTIQFRFAQNTLCFVLKKGESPVAQLWLARELYAEDVVLCDIHLPANTAWDFDVAVLPEHQLTLSFAVLWDQVFQWLADRDIAWVLSRIAVLNRRSTEVHRRLGGDVVGNLVFVRLWNKEICFDGIDRKMSVHDPLHRKKLHAAKVLQGIASKEEVAYEE